MSDQPKKITPIRAPWKGTMTPRERFNRQMHFQPVDRCFNMEFGYWGENYSEWDIFTENGITNDSEADRFGAFWAASFISGPFFIDVDTQIKPATMKPHTDVLSPVYRRGRVPGVRPGSGNRRPGRIIRFAR